jgi:biopolymer transport protein ExbD
VKLNRRLVKRGRIEIIPMIDTILILLIFYMSFSSFKVKEKRIDAKLPVTGKPMTATSPVKVPLDINLHVHDRDKVVVNGAGEFTIEQLYGTMAAFGSIGQEATIVIEAEPKTKYADVVGVLDACAMANLTKVAFRPLTPGKTAPR